jgi:hypothetical protein
MSQISNRTSGRSDFGTLCVRNGSNSTPLRTLEAKRLERFPLDVTIDRSHTGGVVCCVNAMGQNDGV